jgi:hypothetical protein
MSTREYKLAAEPITWTGPEGPRPMREILEFDGLDYQGGENRTVIVVVPDGHAMDVLEALRRAYRGGREDMADEVVFG